MIKRLHLGKAAEGGVTAASLARRGFAGPDSVLEGELGFCRAFSDSPNLSRLTYRLGQEFESLNICIKRYACHINAHAPIEGLEKALAAKWFRCAGRPGDYPWAESKNWSLITPFTNRKI